MNKPELEQTLVLIKPDALKNSLTGYVLSLLSEFHTGLRFAGAKIVHVSRMLAEEHYAEHKGKVFFPPIIDYIMGKSHYANDPAKQRVVAFVYQGTNAIKKVREVSGPTNPRAARDEKPGCIRSLGTLSPLKDENGNVIGERMDNLIHASSSASDAEREIKLWFKPSDIPPAMQVFATEESDKHYYYKNGKLFLSHEKGRVCIFAPGDIAWKSDLEALGLLLKNEKAACSLDAVVAKYLINEQRENN